MTPPKTGNKICSNKLIEHIMQGLRNEPKIIYDPLTISHDKKYLIGLYFYSPSSATLLYSNTATSHTEKYKFPGYTDELWLRGRLFKDKGYTYLSAYVDNSGEAKITDVQFYDLAVKLSNVSKVSIDFAVDSDGYEIG
jgi:hypothetical protein